MSATDMRCLGDRLLGMPVARRPLELHVNGWV